MLLTRMEKWREESRQAWKREWEQQSEQRGRQSGEAALLLRLLEHRFGILPDWARDRVLAADIMMIEDWSLRVLEAASLDQVFA